MNSIKAVWCHQLGHNKDALCSLLAHTDDFLGITATCLFEECSNPIYMFPILCYKCEELIGYGDEDSYYAIIICTGCYGKRCYEDDLCVVCTARTEWEQVYQNRGVPSDIPEFLYDDQPLHELIFEAGMTSSKSEARRLVKQNAVKIVDEKLDKTPSKGDIIKIGKRRFVKLI